MASRTLDVKISASDSASAVFEKVGDSAKSMASSIEDAAKSSEGMQSFADHVKSLDSEIKTVGQAFTGLGAGITAAVGVSVMQFASLESAMANVATIAGQSDAWISQMTDSIKSLSIELGESPTGLAEGLYDIIGSGIEATQAFDVLRTSAIAAKAGLTDTGTAARAVTAILNAYGKSAEEAGNVSDVLFKTVDSGVITFEELAQNLGNTIPLAAQLNVSIEELGAAYAQLTVNGVQASQAETQIAALMRATINETEALTEAVREYGYESAEALIQTEGMAGFLQFLIDVSGGSSAALRELLGTAEAVNAALILGANNGSDYVAMLDQMTLAAQDGQYTLQVFDTQMDTISGSLSRLRASLSVLSTDIGEAFAPFVRAGIDAAASAVNYLTDTIRSLPGPVQTAAVGLTGLAGGMSLVLGTATLMLPRLLEIRAALQQIGGMRGMLGLLTRAFSPLGLAITGVVGAFVLINENMRRGAQDARNYADSVEKLTAAISDLRLAGQDTRANMLETLQQSIDDLISDEAIDEALELSLELNVDPSTWSNQLQEDFNEAIALADEVNLKIGEALSNPNVDAAKYYEWIQGVLSQLEFSVEGTNLPELFQQILDEPLENFRVEVTETQTALERMSTGAASGLSPLIQQLQQGEDMMAQLSERSQEFAITLDDLRLGGDLQLADQLQELDELFRESAASSQEYLDAQDRIFEAAIDGSINIAAVAAEIQRLNEALDAGDITAEEYEQRVIAISTSLSQFADGSPAAIERIRQINREFTEAAMAVAGWDNALSQLNLTGLTGELALFAEEGMRVGLAFDNTFRILVSNVQQIGSTVQQATDWMAGLFALNDQGFSAMDTLVWENRISWQQYEETLAAWNTTAERNYDIQQNLLAVQAMQAPYIARTVAATQQWVQELANMDAESQRVTLAFMDMATVQQAQEIITLGNSEAFRMMGDTGRAAFEAVIQGALQTNPLLFDVLETMGIISGTPLDFDINWDALAEGGSAIDRLMHSVEDLVTTLREIYGLPPLDLEVNVDGAAEAAEEVQFAYDIVTRADGTTAYMAMVVDEDGNVKETGEIVNSLLSADGKTAHIQIETEGGEQYIGLIDMESGEISRTIRLNFVPEGDIGLAGAVTGTAGMSGVLSALGLPESVDIKVNAVSGDGTGGAENVNELLGIPETVDTTLNVTTTGTDDVETVSTAISELPESKTATVDITVTGLEDLESAKSQIDELADKTVTVSIIGDAGGADGVLTVLDNIKSGGKEGHQVTVKLVADDSDVTSAIANLTGAAGGGTEAGGGGGPQVTVKFIADTSALSLENLNLGSLYPDGLEISVSVTTTGHDTATSNLNSVQSAAEAVPDAVNTTVTVFAWAAAVSNLNSVQNAAEAIPNSVTVGVNVSGWSSAIANLNSVAAAANSIPRSVTTTVTTNVVTNYVTRYSTQGRLTPYALGGVAGRYAGGGMVPIWAGENGPEIARFANGGAALLPYEGLYAVPPMTYISPAHANPQAAGGVTIQIGPIYGSNREEIYDVFEREIVPEMLRALREQERSLGVA